MVKLIVDSDVAGRKLERPWLGAKLDAVTREMAEAIGLARVAGAIVARLYDKSPAAEAGMQAGDVIVAVDGHEVADARAVQYRLTTRGIGNRCRLDIVRKVGGGRRGPARAPQAGKDDVRNLSGVHLRRRARRQHPAGPDELGIEDQEGVPILQVRPNSTAARFFQPGDVIQQIGRSKIETVTGLEALLKERQQSWQIIFKRGNQTMRLQLAG